MKKLLLLATALLGFTLPASAVTLTGTYTAALSAGSDATLTDNLPSPFSLVLGDPRSTFVTINPGTCVYNCNPHTATITVTFSNLTIGGHNFGGFTETGLYTANYTTQTDSVVWTGATAQSGFGLDQDGSTPLVFTDLLDGGSFGLLRFNLVDGADWNVITYAEAQLVANTPLPAAVWLFGTGIGGLALLTRRKKKAAAIVAA